MNKFEYKGHTVKIRGLANGPDAFFHIWIDGKLEGTALESPYARAKQIIDEIIEARRTHRYTQRCQQIEEHGRLTSEQE